MPDWQIENSTKNILKVIFILVALYFFWYIREILIILILALILASAMEPLVNYFHQKKVPRSVSIITVYVLVLACLALISYAVIPLVLEQLKILVTNAPQYLQMFQDRFGNLTGSVSVTNLIKQLLEGLTGGGVVNGTFGIFNGVISVISILVIAFYLVAEQQGMKRFIASFVPHHRHEMTVAILEKIQKKMGMWVLGQIVACVVMFLITWLGLSLLKIQYALVLAIIAGILEIIPYIGPIISSVPAIFFGLIQGGLPLAVFVALLYFLLHELEGYILIPKIMQKTVGNSPLVILLALLIGYKLAGAVGIVISVPLVGTITVILNEFWPRKVV